MEHARLASAEGRRMLTQRAASPASLNTYQAHGRVADERIEHPRGIRSAADTRDNRVRQPPDFNLRLLLQFLADTRLEVAHHHGKRMRPGHGTDDVMRVLDATHPVAHRLIEGILQRLLPTLN